MKLAKKINKEFQLQETLTDANLEKRLKYAYLEIGDVDKIRVDNPMLGNTFRDRDKLVETLADWMRDPDNLWFVCKFILNVDLLPFQVVILKEMWTKPFPMLIATRGGSKSFLLTVYIALRALLDQGAKIVVVGAALRQSLVLYNYLQTLWQNSPILQDICGGLKHAPKRDLHMCSWKCGKSEIKFLPLGNGETIRGQRACVDGETLIDTTEGLISIKDSAPLMEMESFKLYTSGVDTDAPHAFVKTKPIPAYKITMGGNYEIICSDIHKLLTDNGWANVVDLKTGDRIKFAYSTSFPTRYVEVDGHTIDEDMGFLLGLLLSEGSVSSKHTLSVKMTDEDCVNLFSDKMMEINPSLNVCRYQYESRYDERWQTWCKPTYEAKICNLEFRELLLKMGLERQTARDKSIPWSILRSPKSVVTAFLRGLFWGDGSAFLYKSKARDNNFGVAYYTGSEKLCNQLQTLITKYDIFVTKFSRPSKLSRQPQFGLRIYGLNGLRFAQEIGVDKWGDIIANAHHDITPRKYEYLSVNKIERLEDRCLYDYHVPGPNRFIGNCVVNHNTVVIADEFASIPPDIFETVVRGFAAVKSVGLVESVSERFRRKTMEDMGMVFEGKDQSEMSYSGTATKTNLGCNQIIIAGTTTYQFNHFYKYYKYYRAIIESCGDAGYLRENYPDMVIPANIDSTQYSIMRIPYDLIPPGMMDESILSQGRATMNSVIFDQEYGCIFPSDSDGFYPATDIHRATCPITIQGGAELIFGAEMYGDSSSWYVMGIDPASEQDHFAICILKIVGNTRHMVYQWSTNRKRYLELKEKNLIDSKTTDYTSFCVKHIRSLIRRFPIKLICCDMGGGGLSIKEGLLDEDKMDAGDFAIYDMDDENTLGNQGSYILKMIRFQDTEWRKESHYGLKKDISDKKVLFPKFDTVQVAGNEFMENSKAYETLDECYTEIEECKYETILIKHDMSNTGTERWDVPKLKIAGADDIKKSLKKDRFTSLLLANWACRLIIQDEANATNYVVIGRSLSQQLTKRPSETIRYIGPNARKLRTVGGTNGLHRGFHNKH